MRELWLRLSRPAAVLDDVTRRELLVQSAQSALLTNALGLGMVALIGISMWATVTGPGLPIWCAVALIQGVALHFGLRRQLKHEPEPPARVRQQVRTLAGLYGTGGVSWGLLTLLVVPGPDHPSALAIPYVVVIMALASNIAFASATPILFRSFHLALALTAGVGLVLAGSYTMAVIVGFCLIAALPLQRDLYLQISGAILLARRNRLLVEELQGERTSVEQTNLHLVEANVELSHRATRDPLTGLANRALFSEHLSSTLARSRAVGRSVSVIYFDLDRFKLINDTHGHAAGDELLRQVGPRILLLLRDTDVLARLGGDEFVVLILNDDGPLVAQAVAERIRSGFGVPFLVDGLTLRVTPSLGVAHDDGSCTGDELVANADAALYRAKSLGRNQVAVFNRSLRSSLRDRALDSDALRRLFRSEGDVMARFQPVFDLHSRSVVAAETVIFLQQPDSDGLSPTELRELAEKTGMIALLDEELLRQACRFWLGLDTIPGSGFRVLNRLGRTDIGFEDLVRFLCTGEFDAAALAGLGIMIGEQQIVSDPRMTGHRIQAIRDFGIAVVLDGFGRGVSSMSQLASLPLDGVRLHPELVRASTSGHERGLLAGILELANDRDLSVTATGVQTKDQVDALRRAGVKLVQGEAVSPALNAEDWVHLAGRFTIGDRPPSLLS